MAAQCLMGHVVPTSNLVGGVRRDSWSLSDVLPLALSIASELQRLREVRGAERRGLRAAGPEEPGRGLAPERCPRAAVTGVPLSHCPAVSGWCLRRLLSVIPEQCGRKTATGWV